MVWLYKKGEKIDIYSPEYHCYNNGHKILFQPLLILSKIFLLNSFRILTTLPWLLRKKYVTKKQEKVRVFRQKKALLEIDSCDSASLESLPGIGPILSSRIIKYRILIGGFVSVEQLREVYGLKEETFNLISSRLFADSLMVRKIKINKADFKGLIRHPYFHRNEVSDILNYRELQGRIFGY